MSYTHAHRYRYFCLVGGGGKDLHPQEVETQRGEYVLAHNGWVMNADPLVNFAAERSQVGECFSVMCSWSACIIVLILP